MILCNMQKITQLAELMALILHFYALLSALKHAFAAVLFTKCGFSTET